MGILSSLQGGTSYDLKPELNLVLKLVIFRFGVYDSLSQSSPGSKLQGLRIASPTTKSSRRRRPSTHDLDRSDAQLRGQDCCCTSCCIRQSFPHISLLGSGGMHFPSSGRISPDEIGEDRHGD